MSQWASGCCCRLQERFTEALLKDMAKLPLDSDRIWSTTVSGKPKSDMLVKLQGQHPNMIYHFVEDKLGTLEKVGHAVFPALTHQCSVEAAPASDSHTEQQMLPSPLPALIRSAGRMQVVNTLFTHGNAGFSDIIIRYGFLMCFSWLYALASYQG